MCRITPLTLALALLAVAPHGASAQEDPPGTRLIVQDDEGRTGLSFDGEAIEQIIPPEGVSLGVRARYMTVPDALFGAIFLEHTSFNSWSVGMEVGIDGPGGSRVIFGLDYTDLSMPAGNFRTGDSIFTQRADPPGEASFTEVDLHMIALDVTFMWKLEIAPTFGFAYGIGLGVAITPGTVMITDVLPNCTSPVEKCGHWRETTRREAELPTPVWPLLSIQAGFYWRPIDELEIRLEGGARTAILFAGMNVRTVF